MSKAVPLSRQPVTAIMSRWMEVDVFGERCLFGFAERHPATGGLSWTLSTRIEEMTPKADRARTASGRVYSLGREIFVRDLNEEGRVALRLLLTIGEDGYPGRDDDYAWVVACKMARHLEVTAPSREDPDKVQRFLQVHAEEYIAKRNTMLRG